jgi:hypothetical protein
MWQISTVYFVVIFLILLFGIASLPVRPKKARSFGGGGDVVKDAMARPMPSTSDVALQQAAMGKESPSYSVDQKITSVSQQDKAK